MTGEGSVSRYEDWGDARIKVRAGRGSRPRTKRRPDYQQAPLGVVVGIDRGRYTVAVPTPAESEATTPAKPGTLAPAESGALTSATPETTALNTSSTEILVQAVKARELPRGSVVTGDWVRLTGDLSGVEGTLARIAQVEERRGLLRRSLEEYAGERGEKAIVANADYMVIVTACAQPTPRVGMVDRCLVAAKEAQVTPILCLTKTDLANPAEFLQNFQGFDLLTVTSALPQNALPQGDPQSDPLSPEIPELQIGAGGQPASSLTPIYPGLAELEALLHNHFSVLVGHSGVGKSTLINALIPDACRAVGAVNDTTGKGRHTSTSVQALPLPRGGWVADTPGMRSFGLQHVTNEDVLATFPGLAEASEFCLPNCTHLAGEPECALDQWARQEPPFAAEHPEILHREELVARARKLLKPPPEY